MRDATKAEPSSSSSGCSRSKRKKKTRATNEAEHENEECSVCGRSKSTSSVLDLSSNTVMQRRLDRDWKLPADVISATLQAICVECVCKLNMHSEVTRKLMQRLQRVHKSSSPPIADAEVSTTGGPLSLDEQEEREMSTDVISAPSSSCSVMQVYSTQPSESPSATESGGVHNDGWKWRTRLVCQHCERAYFRKDLYTLHVRRCWRRQTQHQLKCRVLNEASNDDDDDDDDEEEREVFNKQEAETQLEAELEPEQEPEQTELTTQLPRNSRTFQCRHCDKEFAGVVALRQHQRSTHQAQHRCSVCEAQFSTKYEWDLHHTICSAKQQALQLEEPIASRSTRSRSRACSVAWYHNEDENEDDEQDDEEEDDDATSVADTMYTRRMNFTGDWIVNHSRSNSNSAFNLMLYDDYVLEESQITTDKEYDLYLLDLLKTQVQLKVFSCFVPGCCYQTDTLVDLMKHDYMQHWKMSWYYCHKCGDVFTSKVFLDYHLHRQNRGFYICHKCHEEFEFQHQLDRHQVLHSKVINYHCNYCRLEFLSEAKLLAHCEHERHSPNDEPPLICIDHALSISNPVPKEPTKLRQYTMRVLDIPHIPWPSNRPMHLPHHKPFRFAIGICEFDNRNPPNCVGCT